MAGQQRDVVNHVLFEVATEVANRGQSYPCSIRCAYRALLMRISDSRWYLLCPQIESAGHHCRVWLQLHTTRPSQQSFGTNDLPTNPRVFALSDII